MNTIKHHLSTFIRELKKDSPLRVTPEGGFYVEKGIRGLIRCIFGLEQQRLIEASRIFIVLLESLESLPILFSCDKNIDHPQEADFKLYLYAGELLIQKLERYTGKKSLRARFKLERALVALRYRLEGSNGGLDAEPPCQELLSQLQHAAMVWKSAQQIYPEKKLSPQDFQQLKTVSRYPAFVQIVLRDPELASDFFQWALRDRLPVRPFVEYPCQQYKINLSALNGRLARFGGSDLKIQKETCGRCYEKHLTIRIEGRQVSILDRDKQIVFRGGLVFSIEEIFSEFENKRTESGCLEYMAEGIINWSPHQWGYWDAKKNQYERIDLAKPEWWNQLPVLDHLTLDQARKKFGHHLTGVEWNIALVSARVTQDLNFENSHAYASLAVPQGDGSYVVYTMGKCTFVFPESYLRALFNAGETSEATIAYPDENVFYTHRRKTRFSYAVTAEEGIRFFESVKRDMLLSFEGNLIYQIESENCAKWVYEKLIDAIGKYRVPDVYKMPFLKSEPHGVLKSIFNFLRSLPSDWQIPVTTFIHLFLGAYKGRHIVENRKLVWKSLTFHQFWKDTIIFHPSMLYKQKEEGNLLLFVRAGVTLVGRAALFIFRVGDRLRCLLSKFYHYLKGEKIAVFQPFQFVVPNGDFSQSAAL